MRAEGFDRRAAGDRVVTGALTRGRTACSLGDVERGADRCAVELVGEFRTAQGEPSNDDAAELEGEAVGVETVE